MAMPLEFVTPQHIPPDETLVTILVDTPHLIPRERFIQMLQTWITDVQSSEHRVVLIRMNKSGVEISGSDDVFWGPDIS